MSRSNLITKKLTLAFLTAFVSVISFAQETKKVDIDIDTKPDAAGDASSFFMQPWVWVVGAALFILLLVAILKGNKR